MKEFKNVLEQINLLKSRGIIFIDEYKSINLLLSNNYYNIINGYRELFIKPNTKKYIKGTTFEEIYALYEFDRELRSIFLEYILKIENIIRTQVSYVFSEAHGNDNYLTLENFETFQENLNVSKKVKNNQLKHIQILLSNINKKIASSIDNTPYINHYLTKHGFIPLWVLVNILSFSDICNFYKLMKQKERVSVSKFFNINETDLKSYLGILCHTRNLCAHDERLYNYVFPTNETINDSYFHELLNINKTMDRYDYGKNDLFALMIILKTLLNPNDYQKFHSKIYSRIMSIKSKLKTITINELLKDMHFPQNWHELKKSPKSTQET